jgi:4-hydroxymandelate oxidase
VYQWRGIFINVKPGDKVVQPRSNVEKAGHIIAVGDTLAEAEEAVARCKEVLKIEVFEESELSMEAILMAAREKFKKICYVCKNCDGRDCPTGVPGMGGIGTGASFRRNIESLRDYKINTRLIHDVTEPDTSTSFFGIELSFPVMAAPVTGAVTNLGGAVDELEYNRAVIRGCVDAGTIAFVGDGASPEKYKLGLQALSEAEGMGVPVFKPRSDNNEVLKRIKASEKVNVIGVGMDVDAAVFKTMAMKNQAVGPKSLEELKYLISATHYPFILKGIMNVRDAVMAVEAGAHAIVISNHGGRVLDEMVGSMDVLEEIVREVKGHIRILVDGGFRTGVDILKALALGAEYVLIGRPITIAAVGMCARGVSFYLSTLKRELEKAMILTGCSSVHEIPSDIVKKTNTRQFVPV